MRRVLDLPGNQVQAHRQDIYKTVPLTEFCSFPNMEAEKVKEP